MVEGSEVGKVGQVDEEREAECCDDEGGGDQEPKDLVLHKALHDIPAVSLE